MIIDIESHLMSLCYYRSHVTFGLFSSNDIQKQAHIHVVSKNLYREDAQRSPVSYGVLDRRMVITTFVSLIYY